MARRCRIGLHRWAKNMWIDSTSFSISPLAGERVCERCGKRQQYSYDSQGGCWITVAPEEA